MHLIHPIAPVEGVAAEDCVHVTNEQMLPLGTGHVTMFFQPEMYPDTPLHVYMKMDSQPAGRNLLLGALLARAEQLRAQYPDVNGRLYTELSPDDLDMLRFYEKAGFKQDDSEDLYHFALPLWPARAPVTCNYGPVQLQTQQDAEAFLQRMNAYRITPIDLGFLSQCMQMEHFLALGYYRGNNAVCEALFTGQGQNVTLVSLYVRSDYRRQGFAKAIIGAACDILRPRGVMQVSARVYSRNAAQLGLMKAAEARKVRTVSVLPGITL